MSSRISEKTCRLSTTQAIRSKKELAFSSCSLASNPLDYYSTGHQKLTSFTRLSHGPPCESIHLAFFHGKFSTKRRIARKVCGRFICTLSPALAADRGEGGERSDKSSSCRSPKRSDSILGNPRRSSVPYTSHGSTCRRKRRRVFINLFFAVNDYTHGKRVHREK